MTFFFCTEQNSLSFILQLLFYLFLGQVCLAFGTLILFAGLIVLLVGYATPTRFETFGEDDLLFVDRYRNNNRSLFGPRPLFHVYIRVRLLINALKSLSFLEQPCCQFQPCTGCLQADWCCAILCGRHLHGCGSPAVCLCQKLLQRRTVSAAEV